MRALVVLTGDLDLFPNTNMEAHSYLWHEIKYPLLPSFKLHVNHIHIVHIHTDRHMHRHINT